MRCETYQQLEFDLKSAQKEWAMFTYEEYKSIRATSDRKSKQIATAAKERMAGLSKQMEGHRQNCEVCKSSPGH
jgi:hypothetical protein